MLLEFQGAAAHVREVAEFAAEVFSVALAIGRLASDPDEGSAQRHLQEEENASEVSVHTGRNA